MGMMNLNLSKYFRSTPPSKKRTKYSAISQKKLIILSFLCIWRKICPVFVIQARSVCGGYFIRGENIMKKKALWGIPALVLVLSLVFTGCPTPTIDQVKLSSNPALTAISIAEVEAAIGTPAAAWNSAQLVAGEVTLTPTQAQDAVIAIVKEDEDAKPHYSKVSGSNPPYFDAEPILSLADGDSVYVRVYSANLDAVLYYKVDVRVLQSDADLAGLTIAGDAVDYGDAYKDPAFTQKADEDIENPVFGELLLSHAQATAGVDFVAEAGRGVVVSYAKNTGEYAATSSFQFANGDELKIRLVAEDGETTRYYKILVAVINTDFGLASVTIGFFTGIEPGTPGTTASGAASKTLYSETALTNAAVSAVASDAAYASVAYAVVDTATATPLKFESNVTYNSAVGGVKYLIIRVIAENGDCRFYKFHVAVGRSGNSITGLTITQGAVAYTPISIGTPAAAANVPTADRGLIGVNALSGTSTIAVEGLSEGASAAWAVANATTGAPTTYATGAVTFSATNTNLVIRVTAENGAIQYYRFVAHVRSATATASALTVGGITGSLGTGVANSNVPSNAGAVDLSAAQAANAVIRPTIVAWASVSYGVGDDTAQPSQWTGWVSNNSAAAAAVDLPARALTNGDNLYIRVRGETGATTTCYRVVVGIGTGATMSALTVGGVTVTARGTINNAWTGTTAAGSFILPLAQAANAVIDATVSDGATVRYGIASAWDTSSPVEPTWYAENAPYSFTGGEQFFIEVTASNGTTKNYYRMVVSVN
jgi:hypothetical protein